MTSKPNIGHFCDPQRNHFEAEYWPRHESCSGKVIINSGLYNEQIVGCECSCHNLKETKKK